MFNNTANVERGDEKRRSRRILKPVHQARILKFNGALNVERGDEKRRSRRILKTAPGSASLSLTGR